MRDEFSGPVKRIVADRVNCVCSNPTCRASTSGPQTDPTKSVNIGVAAHISAASTGGPRYDSYVSSEERKHPVNSIWLCQNCAKMIDNDALRYTVEVLREWKEDAEADASDALGKTASGTAMEPNDLTPEEIDILCVAADKGEINLIEVDEINPWIMINGQHFFDKDDPSLAALYYDGLESLEARGLVRHEGGVLYSLTGRGFKLARAMKESLEKYAPEAEEENDLLSEDFDEKIPADKHLPYRFNLGPDQGIQFEVDSGDPVNVYIMTSDDYKNWRNGGELYVGEDYVNKSRVTDEFWSDLGEYFLVVSNQGLEKTKADVKITLLQEPD
jgi:hypothetical protein